ncbi:MAG: hypothetical protein ACPGVY_01435 [Mycobacterium sp.]
MNVSQQSQTRTRMFCRVIGPYIVIACVAAVVRASDMQALFSELDANSMVSWLSGVLALLFGLVVVAFHPYWRGAAAIIVSVVGWLAVLEGLLYLVFPTPVVSLADGMIGAQALWVAFCIVFSLVGLYLTYVGWAPTATEPTSPDASSTKDDLPSTA